MTSDIYYCCVARSPRILNVGNIKNLAPPPVSKISKGLQPTLFWFQSILRIENKARPFSPDFHRSSRGENSLSIVYVAKHAGFVLQIWPQESSEIVSQASLNTLLLHCGARFPVSDLWRKKSSSENQIFARFRQENLLKPDNWGLSFKRNWTCSLFFERNCRGNWRWYNIGHYISGEILIQTLWTWSEFYLRSFLTRYLTYSECPK